VDRVFVDLERLGKPVRQQEQPLFLSTHTMSDIPRIKAVLHRAKLVVRIDPPHDATPAQVDRVIALGADYVMLPFFETLRQASDFVAAVRPRAVPVLLVERVQAVEILPDICALPGLAEIHIGLNDLSLSMRRNGWFSLLTDPVMDGVLAHVRTAGVPFGFGGIASLSRTDLPIDPELVLAEQVCQGASRGWLGRTFRETAFSNIEQELAKLRDAVSRWTSSSDADRERMRATLRRQISANSTHGRRRVS
jgi:citrate lyase beta subunit